MGFKWFTVIIGALWWALGATLDLTVAFGSGGTIVFSVTLLAAVSFLYRAGFRRNKGTTDLWVLIFRMLSLEAVLFSGAILILGLTTPEVITPGTTLGDLFIDYGLPGLGMAVLFWVNAWLLDTKLRHMYQQLEESKRTRLEEESKPSNSTKVKESSKSMKSGKSSKSHEAIKATKTTKTTKTTKATKANKSKGNRPDKAK